MDKITVVPEIGSFWDEKGRDEVAGIYVYYNKHNVLALQFLFYENGNLVKSKKYGKCGYENFFAVVFDYPSEFLTSIGGSHTIPMGLAEQSTFSPWESRLALSAIKIGTNKRSYGPFGRTTNTTTADDKNFNFQMGRSLFGGFHGTLNLSGIVSIGVYVKLSIPSSSMTNLKDPQVKVEKEED